MLNKSRSTKVLVFVIKLNDSHRDTRVIALVKGVAFGWRILYLAFLIFREELGSFTPLYLNMILESWE